MRGYLAGVADEPVPSDVTAPAGHHRATFELDRVDAGPADAPILRQVSLSVPFDGILAVAGPSGAGKSTLLRLLNRLDDPVAGRVLFEDRDLRDWDPAELRRRVGMVFQRAPVFEGTVLDNLRVAARIKSGELADPDMDDFERHLVQGDGPVPP